MLNPLVETCLAISKSGYLGTGDPLPLLAYEGQDLLHLANYLMNHSGLSRKFVFRPRRTRPEAQPTSVIMYGAGIDSTCALFHALLAGGKIVLVHVDYGQPYAEAERSVFEEIHRTWWTDDQTAFRVSIDAVRSKSSSVDFVTRSVNLLSPTIVKQCDFSWENYIIPARNLVLAAIGSEYGDHIEIVANYRADETVGTPDKTHKFYLLASQAFSSFYQREMQVYSPFIELSKKQMVDLTLKIGVTPEALMATFSCYSPKSGCYPCGECYACFKRYTLFQHFNWTYNFETFPPHGKRYNDYVLKEAAKGR